MCWPALSIFSMKEEASLAQVLSAGNMDHSPDGYHWTRPKLAELATPDAGDRQGTI